MAASNAGPLYVPMLPMPHNGAMIFNPGGGDYAGYRIVVGQSGIATAVDGAGRTSNQLQSDVAQKFFNDLAAAGPLEKLPPGDCSSVKAGDATTVEVNAAVVITYNGQRTPALTCVSDPRAVRILLDATTIQHALYVQAYRKRTMLTYGGGQTYKGDGYTNNAVPIPNTEGFYIPQFQNEQMTYQQFDSGNFYFNNFETEYPSSTGPWSGVPGASTVFTNLPYAQSFVNPGFESVPTVYPWQGAPGTSVNGTSPWSNLPNGSTPYSNAPSAGTSTNSH